jgi:hypothetical protein
MEGCCAAASDDFDIAWDFITTRVAALVERIAAK